MWRSCSRRSEGVVATASAGALLTGPAAIPSAYALAAMLLQELAYQLLASPVQFPFEVTLEVIWRAS